MAASGMATTDPKLQSDEMVEAALGASSRGARCQGL